MKDPPVAQHPEAPPLILDDLRDVVIKHPILDRDRREAPIFEAVESSSICADPECPVALFQDGSNKIVGQTLFGGKVGERAVVEVTKPANRAQPETAVRRRQNIPYVVMDESFSRAIADESPVAESI